ncbi:hypothetical protein [Faecalicatena contorta]|uniref:Uncharacterized protein n=1 Tax=Faecalicatena contorta TaxID=39482 RepID=A0A315ZWR1_9FIRM|nr:hypothetical protein [Faecalicatena contorta]PWJ49985.1 hypothetical protein A8805_10580 [Faecalicatena contorta]SUQ14106.1 hypothetical protein SAMN05216529_10580 [Faecalicatena contorta]
MDTLILIILFINLISAILFFIWHLAHRQKKAWMALFFLILPVLGYIVYYLPAWIARIVGTGKYDRESLIRRLEIEKGVQKPQVAKELNIIPVEDAMAASTNLEKRLLLQEQLKKDIYKNYKVVLPAAQDADSESAHYVAAAKMEAYRYMHERMKEKIDKFAEYPEREDVFDDMLKVLNEYIQSDLLAEKEAGIYKKRYCEILETANQELKAQIDAPEWACYLSYLAGSGNYAQAEETYEKLEETQKDENVYFEMLDMYYFRKNKEKFYQCLDELKSSSVSLTAEGLKTLRYWEERRR